MRGDIRACSRRAVYEMVVGGKLAVWPCGREASGPDQKGELQETTKQLMSGGCYVDSITGMRLRYKISIRSKI